MKVVYKDSEADGHTEYPYLAVFANDLKGLAPEKRLYIVFTSPGSGICVGPNHHAEFMLGAGDWSEDSFTPYHGQIVLSN